MMSSTSTTPARKVSRIDEEHSEEVVQEAGPPAQANPFLIDLVIENLFGYCEFKDLAACRLVSKQWFKASLQHWLEKAPMLRLRLDPALSEHYSSRDKEYMSLFLRTAHNDDFRTYGPYEYAGLRQYKKFQVSGNAGIGAHYQLLQQFMSNVGHWVTDLKLKLTFPDLDIYRTVMLSRMSPNLVKLDANICFSANVDVAGGEYEIEQDVHQKLTSLKICHRVENDRDELPVVGWIQLLARYPNLKTLINGIPSAATPQDLDRMLEAAWTIRQADKKVLDLRILELRCVKSDFDLTSLWPLFRDTGLTLETFRISLGSLTPTRTIYEVLDTQAATLNTLVIDKQTPPLQNFEFPLMTSVRRLVIYGHPFENLAFLKGFPALESLTFGADSKFEYMLRSTRQEEHLKGVVIPGLKRLHKYYNNQAPLVMVPAYQPWYQYQREYYFESYSGLIRKLQCCMPNLRDLRMRLDNGSFREVCRWFPRLQRLVIIGNEVDDEGITGIRAGGSERNQNPDNVANLTELKSLTMKHFNEKYVRNVGPTAITDKSVAAFLALPKLKKLDVALNIKLDVDMEVIWAMQEKIKSCEITWAERWGDEEETSDDYENDGESNQTDDGESNQIDDGESNQSDDGESNQIDDGESNQSDDRKSNQTDDGESNQSDDGKSNQTDDAESNQADDNGSNQTNDDGDSNNDNNGESD